MSGPYAKGGMLTGPANTPTLTGEYWVKYFNCNGEQTAYRHLANGDIEHWRRRADGQWIKLPYHWQPATLAHKPWRPRLRHSCERNDHQ